MHATLPLLVATDFLPLTRDALQTLQLNLSYRCNAAYTATSTPAPLRSETMAADTATIVVPLPAAHGVQTLDLTGIAPEMSPRSPKPSAAPQWPRMLPTYVSRW
jgi:hypothetical protein